MRKRVPHNQWKGGVCKRHRLESINAINIPSHGSIIELPPILSCRSINYEDEEELIHGFGRSNAACMTYKKNNAEINDCLYIYSSK